MAGHSTVLLLVIDSAFKDFYLIATLHFTLEDSSEINFSSNSNKIIIMLQNIVFKISSLLALEAAKNNLHKTEVQS